MLSHVRDVVFPWLKSDLAAKGELFAQAMKDAVFIIPKGSLMTEIITPSISSTNSSKRKHRKDKPSMISRVLVRNTALRNCECREERPVPYASTIIQMMAAMLNPKLGETVCDPAGGTAGFLLAAYQQVLADNTSPQYRTTDRFGLIHGTRGDKITDSQHWDILKTILSLDLILTPPWFDSAS